MSPGVYNGSPRRVLVLGVTGMLGHTLMAELRRSPALEVHGSARSTELLASVFGDELLARVAPGVDATDMTSIDALIDRLEPDIVVNCIGVIKQDPSVEDAVNTIALNALFPHLLARLCARRGIRAVHVSTDCVFSGRVGRYTESDSPDPVDLYGRSKLLGEISTPPALTLRTSFIGPELGTTLSLVDWFLSQRGVVNGFTRAIYSGLTSMEFARMLATVVIPRDDLVGLYHVASAPIPKFDLLALIATTYEWPGSLVPAAEFACDRSMLAERFFAATGYRPPPWSEMIQQMHDARKSGPDGE